MNPYITPVLLSPRAYSGPITYQKDSKFVAISPRNLRSWEVLLDEPTEGLIYLLHPGKTHQTGVVVERSDPNGTKDVVPVMRVSLRPSRWKGYFQAHGLRIRKDYARHSSTTKWYTLYLEKHGGIVSDSEHLEGGKQLWRGLIRRFNVSLVDLNHQKVVMPVDDNTPDDVIWSTDKSKQHLVLVVDEVEIR